MELKEIQNKKRALEFDRDGLNSEIKTLIAKEKSELVNQTVEDLLGVQEREGKLDRFALKVYLDDLASKIRNLYDR